MNIISLLSQIREKEIVLPAIQRDFVWSEEKILQLLDSIMRVYPIGIALIWETYNDIPHRHFIEDYRSEIIPKFHENTEQKKLKLVLDGQQRLQSLFIALYGTYNDKELYFNVMSGLDGDDVSEAKYEFVFYSSKEWVKLNSKTQNENNVDRYFVKVMDLINMSPQQWGMFKRETIKKLILEDKPDDQSRFEENIQQLKHVLYNEENILKEFVIDQNLPNNNPNRKTERDVLEIFVRINRGGTPLTQSDLIFSMLKLNWKQSAEDFPEFLKKVNEGNSFELNTDFVIRCLFAVSDLGTKFDLDVLRKKTQVVTLQENFEKCCDAIKSTVDFVQKECWCSSSSALGSFNTLVPLVYYLFYLKNHEVPNDQISNVRKSIYLFGLALPFRRYAESRLWKFIKEELKPLKETNKSNFPYDGAIQLVRVLEGINSYSEKLLQANPTLTLHIVQNLSGAKTHLKRNFGEIDHIFPRSVLREKGYTELDIDHFANYWILAKGKNQNKSAKQPAQYFKDVPDEELKRALIERDLLDYRKFEKFLKSREGEILKLVKNKIQFNDSDFLIKSL